MNAELIRLILDFGNLIIVSANVVIGSSLFLYVSTHNLRSSVARAFCALLACSTLVYVVDISMAEVAASSVAAGWLRLQWVGIAFMPAAYLHFSDALLRTTGAHSRSRLISVSAGYLLGCFVLALALFTDLIVGGVEQIDQIFHLMAGPYFWVFALYYVIITVDGWSNISRARSRCLAPTSRRRMSYLMLAFAAPAAGVFPYLLIPSMSRQLSPNMISGMALGGNLAVAAMTGVIGYIVAYQGVLLPDRVVKHTLLHYLLRGPLVAILVVVIMLTIPRVEPILGLPRDTVLVVTVAGSVVILQVLINLAKPAIDRLIYRGDRTELNWIQTLDQRLLTTSDLEELLHNTLVALCDLSQIPSGFIVTMQGDKLALQVFCGPQTAAREVLESVSQPELARAITSSRQDAFVSLEDFVVADGYWLLPLRSQADNSVLGILGLQATAERPQFSDADLETMYGLVHRAEMALEDMHLQQQVFAVLQGLDTALDQLQGWRANPLYSGELAAQMAQHDLTNAPGFVQVVRDALNQFWGGPKLSQSALRGLRIVHQRLAENSNVPAKAVRAVLRETISRLKPDGKRSMTSNEWLVYNILDLKFIQGYRIRDIAQRMAMSESDFYRKQRVAIEQVADTLAQMERAELGGKQRRDQG